MQHESTMRTIFLPLLAACVSYACSEIRTKPQGQQMQTTKSIYDFTMRSIEGKDIPLSQFKGKKILIVNVASECGYTPQYKDLQKLYDTYKDRLVILGFPANNFGGQEPGSNENIKTFCERNFGVTFPMFSKISVAGDDQDPLYQWLSKKPLNGWNDKSPGWNFCKYLISENGELLKFFSSSVNPMSDEIISQL